MKYLALAASAALLIAAPGNLLAEDADTIIKRHTKLIAKDLETYLKENPDADDAGEAIDFLIGSYGRLEMSERQGELLTLRYDGLPKGADIDPQEFFSTLQPLLALLVEGGKKDEAKQLLTRAKKDIIGHADTERFAQFLQQLAGSLSTPGIGDTLDLKFTSIQGDAIDLSKMLGKVVLVDFWATWCGPCITELPSLQKTYATYHEKGFEIIAISLDNDKAPLETFIKENEMPWPQAFDGKGWQTELATQYGISSIPATFLIGKDGKIVATDLRGDALGELVGKELAK